MSKFATAPLVTIICIAIGVSSVLACALPGQSPAVIIVTATPLTLPSATPLPITPTITPLPSPTIAPTVPVPDAVNKANDALHNGDFDTAVKVYQEILSQPELSVDPRLRAEATIGFGAAALREGRFVDAIQALTTFLDKFPTEARVAQAYFLRGDAHRGASEWALAIADFQQYLAKRSGLIDSYVYERIGDCYIALGDYPNSVQAYANAVKDAAPRGLKPLFVLREKIATTYLNGGNYNAALQQYDAILSESQNSDYQAGIARTAADLLEGMGQIASANNRYSQILQKYPETGEAYRAAQSLLRNGIKVDNLLRGRASFAAQDYNDAIVALATYAQESSSGTIDPNVYMLLGKSYREVGNITAAIAAFQSIITGYPKDPLFGQAWLEYGRTLLLSGQTDAAIAKYKELAQTYPDNPDGAEALWRVGYLYTTYGNIQEALATYEVLGTNYKNSTWALEGLFQGGMAAYNSGDYARAQRLLGLLATTPLGGDFKAAGLLWLGRLYQLDNKPDLARDAYHQAAKADPGGYYSLRANDLLLGQSPYTPPAQIDFSFGTPDQLQEADTWMRKTFGINQVGALWQLTPEMQKDPSVVRGTELWNLAAFDDAKGEFSALTDANEKNPLALYQLASYYYQLGLYREAITAAAKLIDSAKVLTPDAPKYIAGLRFPVAYADLVLPNTTKEKIDPLLVFALIRQESLYDGVATSFAAAQGLMQIIPDTGVDIARNLNWPNYQNSDLYRPYVNVTFGVFYLSEQLQTFDGKQWVALAAYNAGPGAAADWDRISNGDPDLFTQAVSYDETQSYVRRIYEQYNTYAAIYGVKPLG